MKAQDYEIYTITSVVGLGAIAGVYLLVKSKVKANQQTVVQQTGLDAGTASNWAKRLKMAFGNYNPFGWTTDDAAVYQVFNEVPSKKAYSAVQAAYKVLYTKDLNADLQDELYTDAFAEVMRIYNTKPAS